MISSRDYYAANANMDWIDKANDADLAEITGVPEPLPTASKQEKRDFRLRAEIRWRWIYADLMAKGGDENT